MRLLAIFSALCFSMSALAVILILYVRLRQRWSQARHGWFVDSLGDAEGGVVIYVESGRELHLLFDRASNTTYIPSDEQWRLRMPPWARSRKTEIMSRIRSQHGKRLVGRAWSYQETADEQWMMRPDQTPLLRRTR
jgi:hypothetical protein